MFLNESPKEYTPRAFFVVDNSLIDNDVKYYDFQKSKEYQDVYNNVLSSEIQTTEAYFSPYFGSGNGAYRELDKVYEAYRQRFVGMGDTRQAGINPALILAAAAAYFFAG